MTIRMKIKADIQEISLNKKKGILYKNKFKNTLKSMRKKWKININFNC